MAVVLVIDDDESMRKLIARILGNKHSVFSAANGHEGLTLLDEHKPDIVITDILMPQKEGIETMREIQERAPATKIIAISGGGAARNLMFLDVASVFGADAILAKPFRPAQLVQTVDEVLSRKI
jgi:CheY-like chemotaxis protein